MTETIITKICSNCKLEKPISEFYMYKTGKYGVKAICKVCDRLCMMSYYERNKEKCIAKVKAYRKNNPGRVAAIKKAYRDRNREKIASYNNSYHTNHCLIYDKSKAKEYYKKNRDKFLARSKEYYRKNRDKVLARGKAYSKTESGRNNNKKGCHKYRALQRGATVENFSPKEIFERDGYICQICGIKTRPDFKNRHHPKRPELDHIIPLSKGGEHSRRNTQCTCHKCNLTKQNKTDFGDQLRMFG